MFSIQKTQLSHAQKGKKESFTYEWLRGFFAKDEAGCDYKF